MFGCQDVGYDSKKEKKFFYRNWLCQTALFGLYVKGIVSRDISNIVWQHGWLV